MMKLQILLPALLMTALTLACGSYAPRAQEPTAVPVPTFTATAPAIDSAAYRQEISDQGGKLARSIQKISELMQDPQLDDPLWAINMVAAVTIIQGAAKEISRLTPPPDFAAFHGSIVMASATCANFATTLSSAIENSNRDELVRAVEIMQSCSTQLREATALLPE